MSEEKKAAETLNDLGKNAADPTHVFSEGELIGAYKAYEEMGDKVSASNLRQMVSDKYYGGNPDIGHYNATNYPYNTGEIPPNMIAQTLGNPAPLTGNKNVPISTKFKKEVAQTLGNPAPLTGNKNAPVSTKFKKEVAQTLGNPAPLTGDKNAPVSTKSKKNK